MPKGYGSILRILTECVPTWKLLIPTNPSFQGHFDFSFFVIQLLVSSTSMYSTAQQFFALPLLCLSYTVRTTSSILVFFATVNVKKRETYIVSASGRCVFFSNIIVIRFFQNGALSYPYFFQNDRDTCFHSNSDTYITHLKSSVHNGTWHWISARRSRSRFTKVERKMKVLLDRNLCSCIGFLSKVLREKSCHVVLAKKPFVMTASVTIRNEGAFHLSLIHIWRCRRSTLCRSRWSPYH